MARILIVEDEPLISMMLEDWLLELGHEPVGPAATIDHAVQSISETRLDAAIVDINLGGRRCDPVADALVQRGIPFAFATGVSVAEVAGQFAGHPGVSKPYDFEAIRDVISQLVSPASPPPAPNSVMSDYPAQA